MVWTRGAMIADRYRLQQKVGAGGMGEVWAAEHVGVGTKVAMKTLLKASASKHEMVARFKREAYFLGRIQSPHVARVLDFVSDDRWGLVLVMEFVEGEKLSVLLQKEKRLSIEETIEMGADLASALCDLHSANVIHRDLKPANIILRPIAGGGRRAMLVDFGLSRLLTESEELDRSGDEDITGITAANMALGTVEYMAPEQVLNSRDVTPASDLYALGALLYRIVAGRHVFGDLREGHLAHAKITRDPPPLDLERGDRIARGLESVIAHALKRRPAERYDRADLMLAELSSLRDLMRLSALDLDNADTEDGVTTVNRTTTRLPASASEERPPAVPSEIPPSSTDVDTLRVAADGSRANTVRLALAPAGIDAAPAAQRLNVTDPMPTRRFEPAHVGPPQLPERPPGGLPAPAEPEPAPAPAGARAVPMPWAIAATLATLLGGFLMGRATAPDAAPPSVTALAATAVATAESLVSAAPPPSPHEPSPEPSLATPEPSTVAVPTNGPQGSRPAFSPPAGRGLAPPAVTPAAQPLRGKLPTRRSDDPYE